MNTKNTLLLWKYKKNTPPCIKKLKKHPTLYHSGDSSRSYPYPTRIWTQSRYHVKTFVFHILAFWFHFRIDYLLPLLDISNGWYTRYEAKLGVVENNKLTCQKNCALFGKFQKRETNRSGENCGWSCELSLRGKPLSTAIIFQKWAWRQRILLENIQCLTNVQLYEASLKYISTCRHSLRAWKVTWQGIKCAEQDPKL